VRCAARELQHASAQSNCPCSPCRDRQGLLTYPRAGCACKSNATAVSCCDVTAVWCQAAWRSARVRIDRRRLEAERRRAARNRAALRIQTRWRGHAARHGVHGSLGFLTCGFELVHAGVFARGGTTYRACTLHWSLLSNANLACTQAMSCGSGARRRGCCATWRRPASRRPSAAGGSVVPWQLPSRCATSADAPGPPFARDCQWFQLSCSR